MAEMMREVAADVTGIRVPSTAHRIPDEQPDLLAPAVLEFAG
ncbi:MAG: hypothetical protein WAN22_34925 [Solirubrobacteraceae bacterium]